MTEELSKLSPWAKLTISAFTLVGSYFVIKNINGLDQIWLCIQLLLFIALTIGMISSYIKHRHELILSLLFLLCTTIAFTVQNHSAILYVVICLLAIEINNKSKAILWVGSCVIAIFIYELHEAQNIINLQDAILNSLLTIFLSGFSFIRLEAEKSKKETQKLLHELEEKNYRLAIYASEQEEKSRLEERQQLSRELHDTLGHKLTTSIVQIEVSEKYLERDPARVKNILATVREVLKDGLEETRDIVHILDQKNLHKASLQDTIDALLTSFQSATELKISRNIELGESKIPAHSQQHIIRIIQEALTNISRHAKATKAKITLKVHDKIQLLIEDNGTRLSNHADQSLPPVKSIESRVQELQGSTTFLRDGDWTKLSIIIPMIKIEGVDSEKQ